MFFHFSVQKLAGVEGGRPVLAAEGADALLTCVTRNLGDNTLMWKYGSDKVIYGATLCMFHSLNLHFSKHSSCRPGRRG